jgi:hypothetical protein
VQGGVTSGFNLLLGVWTVISPWALGDNQARDAVREAVVVGAVIVVLALVRRAAAPVPGAELVRLVLGGWLIASPFLLDDEGLTRITT